jgi:hypothetical protein
MLKAITSHYNPFCGHLHLYTHLSYHIFNFRFLPTKQTRQTGTAFYRFVCSKNAVAASASIDLIVSMAGRRSSPMGVNVIAPLSGS